MNIFNNCITPSKHAHRDVSIVEISLETVASDDGRPHTREVISHVSYDEFAQKHIHQGFNKFTLEEQLQSGVMLKEVPPTIQRSDFLEEQENNSYLVNNLVEQFSNEVPDVNLNEE